MHRIFIDPDGTCPDYLGVIVRHRTGVTYVQQCGGVANEERAVEGYLVLLSGLPPPAHEQHRVTPARLSALFHRGKRCWSGDRLGAERLPELERMLVALRFWSSVEATGKEEPVSLRVDHTRLAEAVEAWIPVLTSYGPASSSGRIATEQACTRSRAMPGRI